MVSASVARAETHRQKRPITCSPLRAIRARYAKMFAPEQRANGFNDTPASSDQTVDGDHGGSKPEPSRSSMTWPSCRIAPTVSFVGTHTEYDRTDALTIAQL